MSKLILSKFARTISTTASQATNLKKLEHITSATTTSPSLPPSCHGSCSPLLASRPSTPTPVSTGITSNSNRCLSTMPPSSGSGSGSDDPKKKGRDDVFSFFDSLTVEENLRKAKEKDNTHPGSILLDSYSPEANYEIRGHATIIGKMSPEGELLNLEIKKTENQSPKQSKPLTPGSMKLSPGVTTPKKAKGSTNIVTPGKSERKEEACAKISSAVGKKVKAKTTRVPTTPPPPKVQKVATTTMASKPMSAPTPANSATTTTKTKSATTATPTPSKKISPPQTTAPGQTATVTAKKKVEASAAKGVQTHTAPPAPKPSKKEEPSISSKLKAADTSKSTASSSTQTPSKKSSRKRDKYKLETLAADDTHRRLMFATKLLLIIEDEPEILDNILWTDECNFNLPKLNPGLIRKPQVAESETLPQIAWCGITTKGAVGPYFFNSHVTDKSYLKMLENFLIPELQCKGYNLKELWFQQDGAPWHRSKIVLDFLKSVFDYRIISLGTKFIWPPRSQDLTPMDYFFWDYMKLKINFKHSKYDLQFQRGFRDILAKEVVTANKKALQGAIYQLPERLEMCLNCNGGRFQHLLYPDKDSDSKKEVKVKSKIPQKPAEATTPSGISAVPPSRFNITTPPPSPSGSGSQQAQVPKKLKAKTKKPTKIPPRPELNPIPPQPRPQPPPPVQPTKPKAPPIQVQSQSSAVPPKASPAQVNMKQSRPPKQQPKPRATPARAQQPPPTAPKKTEQSSPPPIQIPNDLASKAGIVPVIKFPDPSFPQCDKKSCVNCTIADAAAASNLSEDLFNHNYEFVKEAETEKERE